MKTLATDLKFPEGPAVMADGSVLFTEIAGGTLRCVRPDGSLVTIAETGGGPNGLAIGPDGACYVANNGGTEYRPGHFKWTNVGVPASYTGGYIQRVDPRSGEVRTLYSRYGDQPLSAPNDLVFDAHGGFYFSDYGKRHKRHRDHGGLYYALPDGSRIVEVAYPVSSPNGVGLSPDGGTLYYAETDACRLWAFDILSPGVVKKLPHPSPTGARLVCGLGGYQRFDSLAVEAGGNICIATFFTGCITIVSPDGSSIRQVALPDTFPTNICFGGPDMRTAYLTLSGIGEVVAMPWDQPGLPLNGAG
jgi:gluconolactonase